MKPRGLVGRSPRPRPAPVVGLTCLLALLAATLGCGGVAAKPATPPPYAQTPAASTPDSAAAGVLALADTSLTLDHAGRLYVHYVATVGGVVAAGQTLTGRATVTDHTSGASAVTAGAASGGAGLLRLTPPGGAWVAGHTYGYALKVTSAAGSGVRSPASGTTTFAPPPAAGQPVVLAAWGDCRNADMTGTNANPKGAEPMPSVFGPVMSAIAADPLHPSLSVGLGDFRYFDQISAESATQLNSEYGLFKAQENKLSRTVPDLLVSGNHEYTVASNPVFVPYCQAYSRWFGFGGGGAADQYHRYYVTRWGGVAILNLYTGSNYRLTPACKAWATSAGHGLNDPLFRRAKWQVVIMHVPLIDGKPYEPYGSQGNAAAERNAWIARLYKAGVDVVLQAHAHYFRVHHSTLYANEVDYVTSGNAGAPLIDPVPPCMGHGFDTGQEVAFGYCVISFGTGGTAVLTPYTCDASGGNWKTQPTVTLHSH